MEALESAFELRLQVAEKSLDFLETGSSRPETCGAINTDLYKVYKLRDQLDKLANEDLEGWKGEMAVARQVKDRVRNGLAQSLDLQERVSVIKFPANSNPIQTREPQEKAPIEKTSAEVSKASALPAKKPCPPASLPKVSYLTVQEFESVPKYMKGRFTYDTFNQVVDEFNNALETKYEFLRKGFQAMASIQEKKRFKEWRSHETKETKGRHFVVADDMRLQPTLKSEGNRQKVFTILRHVQRTQEIRGPGPIHRYCVR